MTTERAIERIAFIQEEVEKKISVLPPLMQDRTSLHSIKQALDVAVKAIRNQQEPKWIPVTERLPEYEKPVMGWDAECRDMGIVNYVYGEFLDIIDLSETKVTHWMPLPKPPKEG